MAGTGSRSRRRERSFVLLETMLGVAIFVLGVLAIGGAINNLLDATVARADDQRARLALENRMAEIQAGTIPLIGEEQSEALAGMFEGMTLTMQRRPLSLQNEDEIELGGLFEVRLTIEWVTGRQPQMKEIAFYVLSTQ